MSSSQRSAGNDNDAEQPRRPPRSHRSPDAPPPGHWPGSRPSPRRAWPDAPTRGRARRPTVPGPVAAVSDWMREGPDQIAPFVPEDWSSLGADGFDLSDTRAALRRHFVVDAPSIALRVVERLATRGGSSRASWGSPPRSAPASTPRMRSLPDPLLLASATPGIPGLLVLTTSASMPAMPASKMSAGAARPHALAQATQNAVQGRSSSRSIGICVMQPRHVP